MYTAKPSGCAALRVFARRKFTTSASLQRNRHLPVFTESTNPTLTKLLEDINRGVLLPKHLTPSQRHMVQSPKAQRLNNEPVYVRIGNRDVRLLPNSIHDRLSAKRSLYTALRLSETRVEWDNMEKLLEGYVNAGIRRYAQENAAFARLASVKGCQDILLRCLQRVEATGLSLRDETVLMEVMLGFRRMAFEADWEADAVEKALGFVEQTVELMEKEGHCGSTQVRPGDPRTQPYVIATPLELAARRASMPGGWENEDSRVKMYADRLTAVIEKHGTMIPEKNTVGSTIGHNNPAERLKRSILVSNALKLAQKFLGSNMPRRSVAKSAIARLKKEIDEMKDLSGKKTDLAAGQLTHLVSTIQ